MTAIAILLSSLVNGNSLSWSMMIKSWVNEIEARGWCEFNRGSSRPTLRETGKALGIQEFSQRRLIALDKSDACPNTLSSEFGLGEFPLHTDASLRDNPPRYLILFCAVGRNSATTVLDTCLLDKNKRDHAQFIVNDPRKKRYASFTSYQSGIPLTRFNPKLFSACNDTATELVRQIDAAVPASEIDWHRVSCAIIDNWRMLHGRRETLGNNGGALRRFWGWTSR